MTIFGLDLREVSAVIGFVAVMVLVYRLVTTWDGITALSQALGLALVLVALAGSIASAAYARQGLPITPTVSWLILFARLGTLGVALAWPWLAARTPEARAERRRVRAERRQRSTL